jgi:O-antigen/teichoic acid export membrane protein
MMPIYTNKAYMPSQSDYGDLTLFYTFTAFMNIVYLYGMDSAFMRYYFLGRFDKKDIYKSAITGVAFNAIAVSILIFITSSFLSQIIFGSVDYIFHIKLAATILFLDTFSNMPYLILRAEEKSVQFSVVKIIRFILELALNFLFVVYYKLGFIGILYANALAAFINVLILLPYQASYMKGKWNSAAFMEMFWFAMPMLPNGIAYLIVEVSDKFLMRILLDKDTLGIYSANYKFGTILLFLVVAFRSAWQPFFLKIAERPEAKEVYARVLTYFCLTGVLLIISVSYLIDYVVQIPLFGTVTILGSQYWSGINVIPVILTSYLFYGFYVNFTVGIYIQKRAGLMIIFTGLAAVVNIAANLWLMPRYGIMGAALATLLSYLVMAGSIFIANQKIYGVKYDYGRVIFLLVLLCAMLFILYFWDLAFIPRLLLLISVPVILHISGFFSKNEIAAFRKMLKH